MTSAEPRQTHQAVYISCLLLVHETRPFARGGNSHRKTRRIEGLEPCHEHHPEAGIDVGCSTTMYATAVQLLVLYSNCWRSLCLYLIFNATPRSREVDTAPSCGGRGPKYTKALLDYSKAKNAKVTKSCLAQGMSLIPHVWDRITHASRVSIEQWRVTHVFLGILHGFQDTHPTNPPK